MYISRMVDVAIKISQTCASIKCIVAYVCYRIADGDTGQVTATAERLFADGSDGVGDCDAGQAAAILERIAADGSDGIGDEDAGYAATIIESVAADGGDGVGNS